MKKYLIIGAMCMVSGYVWGLTYAEVMTEVSVGQSKAFDANRSNMYETKLDAAGLDEWQKAIADTNVFVEENSSKNKKKLLQFMNDIKAANDDMINIIKMAYGTIKGTGLDQKKRMKELDIFSKKYQGIFNKMEEVKKRADVIAKTTNTDSEKKAASMVSILANQVGSTALSAKTDLY